MKAFLTGGTGFVGGWVAARFLEAGHELTCLARPTSRTGSLNRPGVRLVTGDLADRKSLREGLSGCDCLLNVGGAYSFWRADPDQYRRANVNGVRTVLGCAREVGVSRVVHVSTVVAWGRPATTRITEETPFGPACASLYARTKQEGDLLAWEYCRANGLPLTIVHPGAILGPLDPKPTGEYLRRLARGRMPARVLEGASFPFVHVRDVAEVILRAADRRDAGAGRYIAVAENLTFGQVNRMVSEIAGIHLPLLRLPDPVAEAGAAFLTGVANVLRKPPPWGMSLDQIRTMRLGLVFDGRKAERELGIRYTPIRRAIEEEIGTGPP